MFNSKETQPADLGRNSSSILGDDRRFVIKEEDINIDYNARIGSGSYGQVKS